LNGESTTRGFDFVGLAGGLGDASAFGFTIALAFVLAFALGFAVVAFAAVDLAAAVFFRIFAAISLIRSSPNRWPLVARGRAPRNEGRVRYQNISATAIEIETVNRRANSCRSRLESALPKDPRGCPIRVEFAPAERHGSDNRTIEGLANCAFSNGIRIM